MKFHNEFYSYQAIRASLLERPHLFLWWTGKKCQLRSYTFKSFVVFQIKQAVKKHGSGSFSAVLRQNLILNKTIGSRSWISEHLDTHYSPSSLGHTSCSLSMVVVHPPWPCFMFRRTVVRAAPFHVSLPGGVVGTAPHRVCSWGGVCMSPLASAWL